MSNSNNQSVTEPLSSVTATSSATRSSNASVAWGSGSGDSTRRPGRNLSKSDRSNKNFHRVSRRKRDRTENLRRMLKKKKKLRFFSKIVCLGTNKIAFSKSLRQFLPSYATSCQVPVFYLGTLESQPSVCLTSSGSCHHRGDHVPFRVYVSNNNEHAGY